MYKKKAHAHSNAIESGKKRWRNGLNGPSATATAQHRHVLVVLQNDLVLLVQVEHGYRAEGGRYAAGLRHQARVRRVDEILDDRVVGRVEVVGQREGTVAVAVEGVVARRRDDPVVPADVREVHVERMPATVLAAVLAPILAQGRPSGSALHYVARRRHLLAAVVRVGVEGRPRALPAVVLVLEAPSQAHVLRPVVRARWLHRVAHHLWRTNKRKRIILKRLSYQ